MAGLTDTRISPLLDARQKTAGTRDRD